MKCQNESRIDPVVSKIVETWNPPMAINVANQGDQYFTYFNSLNGNHFRKDDNCNSNYFVSALLKCCGITGIRPTNAYGWGNCDRKEGMVDCGNSE